MGNLSRAGKELSKTAFSVSCTESLFEKFEDKRAFENKTRSEKIRELMEEYVGEKKKSGDT